ncbi:MAG: phenylacetate--CoA ligase family protein [Candidatus Thermoplasmatota archaeon]|nr:phenylacetate--CoA ligase family protein [Candidatus Thermoplasmatota archaeon]
MNPFYNPVFLGKILKRYLIDVDRLDRISEEALQRYQDKQLRRLVRFADTVPLYHEKFKEAGVHPAAVAGIADLGKLPLVTKDDIKRYYPAGIVSSRVKREALIEVSTSGTSGKILPLFVDMLDVVMGLFAYMRALREYGLSVWKNKIAIIGDFASHTAESGYVTRGLQPRVRLSRLSKNILWLNTNDDPKQVASALDEFHPDFIGGYVGMIGHLALLKEAGVGKNISPEFIATTGTILDPFLKSFIEKQFHAKVFEVYGATESGLIAFQCTKGSYHLMSDLVYAEFFRNKQPVTSGDAGEMIITKLYGNGTPIIRYNAINDIVAPLETTCSCGKAGALIKKIYGRNDLALYLPNGTVMLPSSFSEISSKLLYELKTNKVKNTKIIQHDLTTLEIQVVIEEKLRTIGPSVEEIFRFIQRGFEEKVGPTVHVTVREVDAVDTSLGPRIISKVDTSNYTISHYL